MNFPIKLERLRLRFSIALIAMILIFISGIMSIEIGAISAIGYVALAFITGQTVSDTAIAWKKVGGDSPGISTDPITEYNLGDKE